MLTHVIVSISSDFFIHLNQDWSCFDIRIKEEGCVKEPEKIYNTAVEATLEVIGGKWKPVILFHLTFGKKRNNEFKSLIPAITQKMLTQQLRELEKEGIIFRISYNQVPPKVEYELTEYGWSLKEILHLMCRWGDSHIERKYEGTAVVLANPKLEAENNS
jgi:DNA-binding HxlR family transcriptional regulator